jgi:hypothetical protein
MKYLQPLLVKTTVTCSLQHPENERQRRVNSIRTCQFPNRGITRIFVCNTVLFTTLVGKNTIYRRWNTNPKLISIAICSTCKSTLLVAENRILIRYYYNTANTRALYESIDGPAGQPADNPPNPDWLGDEHGTVPEWAVLVYWQSGQPIWQQFSIDLASDRKWRSGTVANTSVHTSTKTYQNSTWSQFWYWRIEFLYKKSKKPWAPSEEMSRPPAFRRAL